MWEIELHRISKSNAANGSARQSPPNVLLIFWGKPKSRENTLWFGAEDIHITSGLDTGESPEGGPSWWKWRDVRDPCWSWCVDQVLAEKGARFPKPIQLHLQLSTSLDKVIKNVGESRFNYVSFDRYRTFTRIDKLLFGHRITLLRENPSKGVAEGVPEGVPPWREKTLPDTQGISGYLPCYRRRLSKDMSTKAMSHMVGFFLMSKNIFLMGISWESQICKRLSWELSWEMYSQWKLFSEILMGKIKKGKKMKNSRNFLMIFSKESYENLMRQMVGSYEKSNVSLMRWSWEIHEILMRKTAYSHEQKRKFWWENSHEKHEILMGKFSRENWKLSWENSHEKDTKISWEENEIFRHYCVLLPGKLSIVLRFVLALHSKITPFA